MFCFFFSNIYGGANTNVAFKIHNMAAGLCEKQSYESLAANWILRWILSCSQVKSAPFVSYWNCSYLSVDGRGGWTCTAWRYFLLHLWGVCVCKRKSNMYAAPDISTAEKLARNANRFSAREILRRTAQLTCQPTRSSLSVFQAKMHHKSRSLFQVRHGSRGSIVRRPKSLCL